MIVPTGKRKLQVHQGSFRNEEILNSDLWQKFGQGLGGLVDDPVQKPNAQNTQNPNPELQDVMNSGGLDHDGMADQLEDNTGFENPQGFPGRGSPASQFLGKSEEDQQQADPNVLWRQEREKIRKFIGNDFGMTLKANDDGTFIVTLSPPRGVPVQDPSGFMNELLRYIGGASVNEESTPAATDASGNLTLKYRPGGAPQKIRPRGKRR